MIQREIFNALMNGQTSEESSIASKFPFPYHWIPGEVRFWLQRQVFRHNVNRMRGNSDEIPAPYADNSTDLKHAGLRQGAPHWTWPEGKKCALVLSHDTDTNGQEKGITMLRELGLKHGLPNTFSFVGQFLEGYRSLLTDLLDQGVEIALHDIVHDNKIAFLTPEEVGKRLEPLRDDIERFEIVGFRSPSWYTSPNLWEGLNQLGFKYDMSVLDTHAFFSILRSHGVGTFFPFIVDGLVLIPNTIPFELPWLCGYKKKDTMAFWKPKFDLIAKSGGLIMFNAHSDRWSCGNAKACTELERCLDYIISTHDPAKMNAAEVADHFHEMKDRGATSALEHALPPVRHLNLSEDRFDARVLCAKGLNPFTVHPKVFLQNNLSA